MSAMRIDTARVYAAAEAIQAQHDVLSRLAAEVERAVSAGAHAVPQAYLDLGRAYQDAVSDHLISALYDYRAALDKVATAVRASADAYVATEKTNLARVSR